MKSPCIQLVSWSALIGKIALLCLISHTNVSAQSPTSALEKKDMPINARFMSWERATQGLYTSLDGKKFSPIDAPAYRLGRASNIPKHPTLRLYHQIQQDGEVAYAVLTETPIPNDATEVQVYLVRQGGNATAPAYRVVVVPNDLSTFPAGEMRILNFSPHPAMVKMGEVTFPLAPLEWKQTKVNPDRKFRVILATALNVGGAWISSGQEILSLRPEYRGDAIIVHTAGSLGVSLPAANTARPLTVATAEYAPIPADNNSAIN